MRIELHWSPLDGALLVCGSRNGAIETLWRMVPEDERTPARRKLTIALVDHIREWYERTGRLAPSSDPLPDIERVVVGSSSKEIL